MAVIEITKRNNKFYAQFRTDDGRIDAIAGKWDSQHQAKRGLQAWKQQVNRASVKIMPISPLPEPEEVVEPEVVLIDPPDDESLHGAEPTNEDNEDATGDSQYTVGELMDYLKSDLIDLAEQYGLDTDGTKTDIAQRIVEAQG